jgi:hypothetical protein
MGYTHYYYRPEELDEDRFAKMVDDLKELVATMPARSLSSGGYYKDEPLLLGDAGGEKALPLFDEDLVSFNGYSEGEKDMSHETYYLSRVKSLNEWEQDREKDLNEKGEQLYFDCTKTARKPYDLMVQAALIVLKKHFGGEVRVDSDGDAEDWEHAMQFVELALGYESSFEYDEKKGITFF